MDNATLLARLDAAFKAVTDTNTLGDSILATEKFDRFVEIMQHRATVLPEARFIEMRSHKTDIDRVGFVGELLRAARTSPDFDTGTGYTAPTFVTETLDAVELRGDTSLTDAALRRNIERGNFESTLVDLFGAAGGRDFESFCLLSDSSGGASGLYGATDGWARKAENKVYGRDVSGQVEADFDPTDDAFPENMFDAMLAALPKEFFVNPGEWRIYCNWNTYNAYVDILKQRQTALGDEAQTGALARRPWKGIEVVYAPMLERSAAVNLSSDSVVKRDRIEGQLALLTHPDNTAWGVFHEITIEPSREAKDRATNFHLTVEGDAGYEDPNGAVVALLDKANPELAGS